MNHKDCQIVLDNPWNSYHPGQTINGMVKYTFDTPITIRGIFIQFRGFTKTSWLGTPVTERKVPEQDATAQVPYIGEEECFNITYYIMGSKKGSAIEIPAGFHSYPFSCVLPPSLPSSFEEELGHVRYTIKTTVDIPWKFDLETEMLFTIVNILDLNTNPENRKPIHMQMETNFCCFWCKTGPLALDVHIPISGFSSGQTVPIEINCENSSDVRVNIVEVEIRKVMVFRTQFPKSESRNRSEAIVQLKLGRVNVNSSKNWKESLNIPLMPPPDLTNCGLIDLSYELKVKATTQGCHMNLEDATPITLGTVPISGFEGLLPSDSVMQDPGPQPGAESPLLTPDPGMPYPGSNGQMQPNPGYYGQQPPPVVYNQPQPSPGAYEQQQPAPGAHGQPQPQTQFPVLPGWVNPQSGEPTSQKTGVSQNLHAVPASQNMTTPGTPLPSAIPPQQ